MFQRVYGRIPDRPDSRDFDIRRLMTAELPLPARYMVDSNPMIYDQGSEPACVGYMSAGVKTDQEYIQWRERYKFDGLGLYRQCKAMDGYPNEPGTEIRFAMHILADKGIRKMCKKTEDSKWKIKAYYRVPSNSSIEFIKQVIYQFGSIGIGSWWYRSWESKFDVFPQPDRETGGHAYRCPGWNEVGFAIANSWGTRDWGSGGIAIMPFDIFEGMLLNQSDVWKLVDAK